MASKKHPLFDPAKARGPRKGPDVGADVTDRIVLEAGAGPMSVSALVVRVKAALADAFPAAVDVIGQMSNCKIHSSGHLYFRLKDSSAAVDAVMWRSDLAKLKFKPTDGLEVIARGRVDVYEVRGQLQLYVQSMTPKGTGALELAFRQLKEKLEGEGLFAPAAKKPIAGFPRGVGIVTSRTGAAMQDIARTLRRRWPGVKVFLAPALVQGDKAAASVAEAVRLLDEAAGRLAIDTIIVARGGGSLEDLWPFNEEIVARAVFAARTPVISGVGHESDITICDLVADARAATPTAAAELAVPDALEVRRQVAQLTQRLTRRATDVVAIRRTRLDGVLRAQMFRNPTARLDTQTQRLDELSHRLAAAARHRTARGRRRIEAPAGRLARLHPALLAERVRRRIDRLAGRLGWALGARAKAAGDRLAQLSESLAARQPANLLALSRQRIKAAGDQLQALGYRNVLKRGYSVTRRPSGQVVRSASQIMRGDLIRTELADGKISSKVTGCEADADP